MSSCGDGCKHDLSRRRFLENVGLTAAAGGMAVGAVGLPAVGWAEDSGPVDCGPPPKAKPQHRTGGEGFAPLPLPATPLRRTEKKRPPAPPALIGKMAPGPHPLDHQGRQAGPVPRLDDRPGRRRARLLLWTNEKLGINYRSVESDFDHFSFDPRELPALLFAGHNKFTLTDEVRQHLARYVAGRRHDHRRRLLRLERFRRVLPPRDGSHLPRPAAAEDAARGAGVLVVLQAGRRSPTRRATARPTTPSPAWKGSISAAAPA